MDGIQHFTKQKKLVGVAGLLLLALLVMVALWRNRTLWRGKGTMEIEAVESTHGGDVKKEAEEKGLDGGKDEECEVLVDVEGAVMTPGVYCLKKGDVVFDAVHKAGGFNKKVWAEKFVMQRINLAKEVEKGMKVYVPFRDDVVCRLVQEKADVSSKPIAKLNDQKILTDIRDMLAKMGDSITSNNKELLKSISVKLDNLDRECSAKGDCPSGGSNQGGQQEGYSDNDENSCVSINNASKEELQTLNGVGASTAQKIIDGRPYQQLEDILNVKGIGEATYNKIKDAICL